MNTVKREITKEEYESMKNKSYSEINNFIKSKLSDQIICGYGYYGGRLIEKDDKYFMEYEIGSSCD